MTIRKGLLKFATLGFGLTLTAIANADINGTIFRDYNLNGVQDALEPGVSGITVSAFDDAGPILPVATTDANGDYTLTTPAGKYRVEITSTPSYLNPGTAINGSTQPLLSFVDDATTHDVGLSNAGEYCQANPNLVVTRFVKGSHTDAATNTIDGVLQYSYADNGTTAPTDIAPPSSVGSVYGVTHFRKTNATYVSSYFKRHSDLGPDGVGAIYKIDHDSANAVSLFTDLGGTDPRNAGAGYDWDHDTNGYAEVAKVGIGDIEISDDETKLFAVNMEDRKLYVFDLDANGDKTTTNSFDIPKPCAAQTTADDSRPMGLGFNDGTLYVGVTCSAESTVTLDDPDDSYLGPRKGDSSKLSAHVYSFNPNTTTFSAAPVVDIPLDYGRGCIYNGDISNAIPPAGCAQLADHDGVLRPFVANWLPWQMDYDVVVNDKKPGNVGNQFGWNEYPQPLLSDIEFDNDGSMIIQIKDVNGDRTGYQNHSPNPADNTVQNGNAMGDIIRACGSHVSGWTLENNGTCGGVTTGGANNNEGPGGGEFYWYDNGPGGNGNMNGDASGHADTVMGGMLQIAGYPDLVTTAMDVHTFADNGLVWLRNDNGEISVDGSNIPKRLQVSNIDANLFFGKASGLGDIEALCDPAPIEIGNYVWEDANNNGLQDPSEAVLPNVTVELYDGATLVGTAVTDANGEYYFGGVSNANMTGGLAVKPLTNYQIRIALGQSNLGGRVPTLKDANSNNNDTFDSDGDNGVLNVNTSTIAYTTGQVGESNHTLDFGFVPSVSIGSLIWEDKNLDGIQGTAANEPRIAGAKVNLLVKDGSGNFVQAKYISGADVAEFTTLANGQYYFTNLPEGEYRVTVDVPATYAATPTQNASGFADANGVDDSNIDLALTSGTVYTSGAVTLTTGAEPTELGGFDGDDQDDSSVDANGNMTVDLGFVKLGSWSGNVSKDTNNDDVGDVNLSGVEIKLYRDSNGDGVADGGAIATTTTGNDGNYSFSGLMPGDYVAIETQPAGLQNVIENEGGADNDQNGATPTNIISGTVDSGENDASNDFVEEESGSWSGNVSKDTNNDDTGDVNLSGVEIKLYRDTNGDGQPDGVAIATATTGNNGNYFFSNLQPGDYVAVETQPAGLNNVKENEGGLDNDKPDNNTINSIAGTVDAGETDVNNDFVEEEPLGSWSGNVSKDTNNDDTGDVNLNGVEIKLYQDTNGDGQPDGAAVATTTTGPDGNYSFTNLQPGDYVAVETQPAGLDNVKENEGGLDNDKPDNNTVNSIAGTVDAGETDVNNDFVEEEQLGSWSGNVSKDINNDDTGDVNLENVGIELFTDPNGDGNPVDGVSVGTTTTDPNGNYSFTDLQPGDYVAIETQPAGLNNVKENEGGLDNDKPDNNTINSIAGTVDAGETDVNNDFVEEEPLGSWSGNVSKDNNDDDIGDENLENVGIELFTDPNGDGNPADGVSVGTTTTDPSGNYSFDNLQPGDYVAVETQPAGLDNVKENEGGLDNDKPDNNTLNSIAGTVDAGEADVNNDFVEEESVAPMVSIGSIIWIDTDNDGIQDAGESGISGVKVTLLDGSGNPVSGVPVITTNASGLYDFDNLPEGDYRVQVEPPAGFIPSVVQTTTSNNDDPNDSNIASSNGNIYTSGIFSLTVDGEPDGVNSNIAGSDDADNSEEASGNMTVDFGFVPTVKIGSLIWFEDDNDGIANGVITYPPAGTIVTATAIINGTTYSFTGTTDTNGTYGIEVPINNEYTVTINPPTGYQPTANSDDSSVPDDNSEDNKTHNGAGTKVVVGLVDNTTVDFGFTPSAAPPPSGEPIPTLSEWALMMLIMMLGLFGYRQGLVRKD